MNLSLGIELGSTRIKAVGIDSEFKPVLSGDYTWKSDYIDGIWTYSLDEVWTGLRQAVKPFAGKEIDAAGISAMMHGYLAFDKEWNLLVPFRTWQNTITGQAADELTALFNFNVPQRWSIAHLYQAILNGEEHVPQIAHITTLAGYVHYMLTGENVLGVGDASGMFPIDSSTCDYNKEMVEKFDELIKQKNVNWTLKEVLPKVLTAGTPAGKLTAKGAELLGGALKEGIALCPAEGDAGTGMTATNAVKERTGNVSAGTSVFSMVVLEKPLNTVHQEIDIVTTPSGKDVAMVHCNNCTNDMNAWAGVLKETAELFEAQPSTGDLYTKLYMKSLEGEPDCGGLTVCNYMAGEGVTHMDEGRPLVVRTASSRFTLANFVRAQLYSTLSTLKIGMDILAAENVKIDSLTGHGGLFKTPGVGQSYLAAACNAEVRCMETAGEGGPYGMALLAAYLKFNSEPLETYLADRIFANAKFTAMAPKAEDVEGFNEYIKRFIQLLKVEETAVNCM